ncbi:MAG: HU family DNA-binding protein [Bacteroidaceae bacterium]|nr:HU family DNA-binding protein [Bacteroidaceae bacterium]
MALIYEVRKTTLNFKKEKPTVYKVAAVRQQTVGFDALVKEVASSCGVHRTQSKAVVEALIDRLIHYMDLGLPVNVGELGSFKPTIRTKVKETADEVNAGNVVRRVVRFYPGKRLKDMLEDLSIITLDNGDAEEAAPDTEDGNTGGGGSTGNDDGNNPL